MQSQSDLQAKIGKSLDELMEEGDGDRPKGDKAAGGPAGERKPRAPPTNVTNRVYVGNLPWQTSWQDLKDHFRQCGEPVHASVFLDENGRSKGCGIVEFATKEEALKAIAELNDTNIGSSARLIFVREDREDRNAPRTERPEGFTRPPRRQYGAGESRRGGYAGGGGAPREYSAPHSPSAAAPAPAAAPAGPAPPQGESLKGKQVFVGNLPYHTSWQDLKDTFRAAGTIVRADIIMLPNGRSKGQGTVLFETKEEALKAIEQFDGTDFQGRKITVHEDRFVN